jgi:hypothetical protein
MRGGQLSIVVVALAGLTACSRPTPTPVAPRPAPSPMRVVASVQEIMAGMVDPFADAVWEAVSITITAAGENRRQPRTDAQWQQLRLHNLALIESANLLMLEGRRVVRVGGHITDEGFQGVLTTEQAEKKLLAERAAFVQFAGALREVANKMLQAVDARDPEQVFEVGTQMDEVCESCHVVFWYPTQQLPSAPTELLGKGTAPASH